MNRDGPEIDIRRTGQTIKSLTAQIAKLKGKIEPSAKIAALTSALGSTRQRIADLGAKMAESRARTAALQAQLRDYHGRWTK